MTLDIASASSRVFWLVRDGLRQLPGLVEPPRRLFLRFADAVLARAALDPTPPLEAHPAHDHRLGDRVVVDGVGTGRVAWIHPRGDLRVELDRKPGSAEYLPIAAVRRAVEGSRAGALAVVPIGLREANAVVERLHRKLGAVQGHKFALGLRRASDGEMIGAAVCARPVAWRLDDGLTAEVRRVAVTEGVPNGCTKLLGAVARAAGEMGYRRLVTYTGDGEPGTSLLAAGWDVLASSAGGSWSRTRRPRAAGADEGRKVAWVKVLRGDSKYR